MKLFFFLNRMVQNGNDRKKLNDHQEQQQQRNFFLFNKFQVVHPQTSTNNSNSMIKNH